MHLQAWCAPGARITEEPRHPPPTDLRPDRHSCPNLPSPRVLSGDGSHPVMRNQGAVGTPHPLFPGFPSRSPSLQTLPLKDSRDHSLGPSAVASILAPCLQRSTPCQVLPCETQISKMHSATWRFLLETLLGSLIESHCFQNESAQILSHTQETLSGLALSVLTFTFSHTHQLPPRSEGQFPECVSSQDHPWNTILCLQNPLFCFPLT